MKLACTQLYSVHKQQFINRSAPTHTLTSQRTPAHGLYRLLTLLLHKYEISSISCKWPVWHPLSRISKWREQWLGLPCQSTTNAITAEPSDLCVCFIWHSHTSLTISSSTEFWQQQGHSSCFWGGKSLSHSHHTFLVDFHQLHLEQDSSWNTQPHTG